MNRGVKAFDKEFAIHARNDAHARRLLTIPVIGALNATVLVAAIGDARTFVRRRDLAAWLGSSRQATTGGKPRLLGITKRGSTYPRKMLIQGARAAMPTLRNSDMRLGVGFADFWRVPTAPSRLWHWAPKCYGSSGHSCVTTGSISQLLWQPDLNRPTSYRWCRDVCGW